MLSVSEIRASLSTFLCFSIYFGASACETDTRNVFEIPAFYFEKWGKGVLDSTLTTSSSSSGRDWLT